MLFSAANIEHLAALLFYSVSAAIVFSLLGLIVGLWAEQFEHLTILNVFGILPLTFLGGMFNSVDMLPEKLQIAIQFNPFFYFIDGIRYSMIGVSESNRLIGILLILSLIVVLGAIVWHLFRRGWKLRE